MSGREPKPLTVEEMQTCAIKIKEAKKVRDDVAPCSIKNCRGFLQCPFSDKGSAP